MSQPEKARHLDADDFPEAARFRADLSELLAIIGALIICAAVLA